MPISQRFRGRYGSAVAIALLGLCPNIVLSTAFVPLSKALTSDLGAGSTSVQMAEGLSNAGYAWGAVLAAQLSQRFVQRRLFLGFELLFVVGSLVAAFAPALPLFFAGRVLQGGATGCMLVSALPPLVTRFGVGRLPLTVVIVNIGLFGATTLGPVVGGAVAQADAWRLLFALSAVLGAVGWGAAWLGYVRFDPPDPDLPVDRAALLLALAATTLPFFGTSLLSGLAPTSPAVLVPCTAGLVALAVLIVLQYRKADALMPVKDLSSQLPVTGTIVAMIAGAVFVTVVQLVQLHLQEVSPVSPLTAGLMFLPMPVGLVVAAVTFGLLFRTRFVPVLINVGLLCLAGASVLLLMRLEVEEPTLTVAVASLLLGFGAGATVSPGLFQAALGVASQRLGRAFALVELLRAEAAFAVTPIVVYLVEGYSHLAQGIEVGLVLMLVLSAVGLVASLAIPLLSGARLRAPDLHAWLDEGRQALPSPTTAAHVRPRVEDDTAEPLLPRRRR